MRLPFLMPTRCSSLRKADREALLNQIGSFAREHKDLVAHIDGLTRRYAADAAAATAALRTETRRALECLAAEVRRCNTTQGRRNPRMARELSPIGPGSCTLCSL